MFTCKALHKEKHHFDLLSVVPIVPTVCGLIPDMCPGRDLLLNELRVDTGLCKLRVEWVNCERLPRITNDRE